MIAGISAALAGIAAGMVHVLSGPDHLAAVLPFSVSAPKRALRTGMVWGLGHGLGVVLLGALFMATRASIDVDVVSHAAEVLVGFLLAGVGVWAVYRSRKIVVHTHEHDHLDKEHAHPHVHIADRTVDKAGHAQQGHHRRHTHSTLGLGFIHGIAGLGHLVAAGPMLAR